MIFRVLENQSESWKKGTNPAFALMGMSCWFHRHPTQKSIASKHEANCTFGGQFLHLKLRFGLLLSTSLLNKHLVWEGSTTRTCSCLQPGCKDQPALNLFQWQYIVSNCSVFFPWLQITIPKKKKIKVGTVHVKIQYLKSDQLLTEEN